MLIQSKHYLLDKTLGYWVLISVMERSLISPHHHWVDFKKFFLPDSCINNLVEVHWIGLEDS